MQGRVQVHFPWGAGLDAWAPVAAPMAGRAHGFYFMPQVGQQVLVAFNNGDIGEPYVIGALWNALESPPMHVPIDAVNKRVIRTPLGHQVTFDDATQTLAITSTTQQKITLNPALIELTAGLGAASVQVTTDGTVRVNSATRIELNAPEISLNGTTVSVNAATSATLNGGASCSVQGAVVKIN